MLSIHCSAVCSAFVSIVALLSLKSQELNEKEERKSGQSTANQADKSDKQLKRDKKQWITKATQNKGKKSAKLNQSNTIGRLDGPDYHYKHTQTHKKREIERTFAKQIAQFKAADKQQQ